MRTAQSLIASAVLLVLMATRAPAQQAPYTEGSVWNLTFIRVKPAMGDRYLNDLRATVARQFAEAQRQGLLLSWKLLRSPAANRDDWDVMIMAEYRNMAALDGLREKSEPIAVKVAGTPAEREAKAVARTELREILGSKLARELKLRDSVVVRPGK
jgi:hypothetical protein